MALMFHRRLAIRLWAFPWLRPSRSLARVRPSIHRDEASAANGDTAADALDLVRMDDDGGWQMAAGDASSSFVTRLESNS